MTEDMCGVGTLFPVLDLVFTFIEILYILIPVCLIIYALIDFGKEVISDNLKDSSVTFKRVMKKVLLAIMVFFVVPIVLSFVNYIVSTGEDDEYVCLREVLSDFRILGVNYSNDNSEEEEICVENGGTYYRIPLSLFDQNSVSSDYTINENNAFLCIQGEIE